ncbi:MAG: hypothetical protein HC897_01880 [Thermoanaerobaculia bacterium]|nr:hypothetical protein [Thermoanaerobaculia bacterium]
MDSEITTPETEKDLTARKKAAERFFYRLRRLEKEQRRETIWWQLIAISIAVASIVLSIYGGVIAESQVGFLRILKMPRQPQRINLSTLISTTKPSDEVYIFALDASGSLTKQPVPEEDSRIFLERIRQQREGSAMPAGCSIEDIEAGTVRYLNQWHLARAQLCCYIDSFKDGPRVGILTFGSTVDRIGYSDAVKFQQVTSTLRIPAQDLLKEQIMAASAPTSSSQNYYNTNFEELLDAFQKRFIENTDYKKMELHFIILSDFEHDIGDRSPLSYEWSMERIAARFSDIGKYGNVMFHLATTRGSHNEIRSVVRVVEETMGWYQHKTERFDKPTVDSGREFFHSFETVDRDLTFFYPAGTSKFQPIHLVWDKGMPGTKNTKIVIGLMNDVYGKADDTAAIHVAEGYPNEPCSQPPEIGQGRVASNTKMQRAVLRFRGRSTFEIERPDDYICLQPLNVDGNKKYGYRLTLSQIGEGASRKTSVLHLNFQPVLPNFAFFTLVGCLVVMVFAACFIGYSWYRERVEEANCKPEDLQK